MPCNKRDRVSAAAGVPIWIDAEARIAHAKTMAIDEAVTLTGSYNWTPGAPGNSENLNLVSSPAIATAYAARCCQAPALWRTARCAGGCRLGFVMTRRWREMDSNFRFRERGHRFELFAVGTAIAGRPPPRSGLAQLRHPAPTLGV